MRSTRKIAVRLGSFLVEQTVILKTFFLFKSLKFLLKLLLLKLVHLKLIREREEEENRGREEHPIIYIQIMKTKLSYSYTYMYNQMSQMHKMYQIPCKFLITLD